jgi:hypothetical protein
MDLGGINLGQLSSESEQATSQVTQARLAKVGKKKPVGVKDLHSALDRMSTSLTDMELKARGRSEFGGRAVEEEMTPQAWALHLQEQKLAEASWYAKSDGGENGVDGRGHDIYDEPEFIAAASFEVKKLGYSFKRGVHGMGYYRDENASRANETIQRTPVRAEPPHPRGRVLALQRDAGSQSWNRSLSPGPMLSAATGPAFTATPNSIDSVGSSEGTRSTEQQDGFAWKTREDMDIQPEISSGCLPSLSRTVEWQEQQQHVEQQERQQHQHHHQQQRQHQHHHHQEEEEEEQEQEQEEEPRLRPTPREIGMMIEEGDTGSTLYANEASHAASVQTRGGKGHRPTPSEIGMMIEERDSAPTLYANEASETSVQTKEKGQHQKRLSAVQMARQALSPQLEAVSGDAQEEEMEVLESRVDSLAEEAFALQEQLRNMVSSEEAQDDAAYEDAAYENDVAYENAAYGNDAAYGDDAEDEHGRNQGSGAVDRFCRPRPVVNGGVGGGGGGGGGGSPPSHALFQGCTRPNEAVEVGKKKTQGTQIRATDI